MRTDSEDEEYDGPLEDGDSRAQTREKVSERLLQQRTPSL